MNHFIKYGESIISAPQRARERANEKRAATRAQRTQEKALQERHELFALWKKHHREQSDGLLAGPHGAAAQELMDFMQGMTLGDGEELLDRVRAGPWRVADEDTRFIVLSLIDSGLVRLREKNGLPPFDDSIPWLGEELTVFEIIRAEFET